MATSSYTFVTFFFVSFMYFFSFFVKSNNQTTLSIFNSTLHLIPGGYAMSVSIGTPPQPNLLIIDTGSFLNWWQCEPYCKHCLNQPFHVYNSTISSSFKTIDCSYESCEFECLDKKCNFHLGYQGGSSITGITAFEKLQGSTINNIMFGCVNEFYKEEKYMRNFGGIAALGRDGSSLFGQLNAAAMSMCLLHHHTSKASSSISFYSGSPPINKNAIVVPMFFNELASHLYYVNLTQLSIQNQVVPIKNIFKINEDGFGGTIVDTGATYTVFPPDIYILVRDQFKNATRNMRPVDGEEYLDTCYNVSSDSTFPVVPSVKLSFSNGASLTLEADQIILPSPSSRKGVYCLGFQGNKRAAHIVIGTSQLQGMHLTFDVLAKTLALTPRSC